MRRVLVTGASGFVGRAAVSALRARGFEVHAVARTAAHDMDVDAWHERDLLEPSAPGALVHEVGASHVLHLAWTTAHGRFWADATNLAWARATLALVEAFAAAGGTRAVVAGSCAQYDWSAQPPALEYVTPRAPATLYGQAKQAATGLLETWSEAAGLSYATALLFFPYGPHEKPDRLVAAVARGLLLGEEASISAGTQVRDFMHVDDCGAALAALVDGDVRGAVNVGTGRGVAVAEIARTIARIVGREELLRVGALPTKADGSTVVAATTRLRGEVGFVPRYDVEAGLRSAVEWWRALTASGGGSRPARR